MKNRIYWCCCAFFSLAIIFSFAYYVSFRNSVNKKTSNHVNQSNVVTAENMDVISVDAKEAEHVGKNAKFTVQSYDMADSVYSDQVQTLPEEYVGLTRPELEQKLGEYTRQVSKDEQSKGLLYVTVVSFSKDSITVRKVYDNKANYKYYISVKDGYVVVYDNDKSTVVDETGILYKNLQENQKQEVDQGVYIDDLSQLYSTLESYTS